MYYYKYIIGGDKMKVVEIKDFLDNEDEYVILTVEEVKQRLNELEIDAIDLGGKATYRYSDEKVVNVL